MRERKVERYEMPDVKEMNRRAKELENLWKTFLRTEGEENLEYYIHKQNMFEVIKRQDQRMHYYNVFHDLGNPCEYKYIAIECFWINTLKPFIIIDETSKLYDCPNEKFSLFLILSTIRAIHLIYKKDENFEYPSKERIRDILYDFKYCSMSREAMISFVETFADVYGVGIDFIFKEKKLIEKTLDENPISKLYAEYDELRNI